MGHERIIHHKFNPNPLRKMKMIHDLGTMGRQGFRSKG